jgi:hypothetical protein
LRIWFVWATRSNLRVPLATRGAGQFSFALASYGFGVVIGGLNYSLAAQLAAKQRAGFDQTTAEG